MTRASQQQGMMLLEVIVALAVFAGAALALMNSMSGQMSATSRLSEHLFADWVSANWLAEEALAQQMLTPSVTEKRKPQHRGSADMAGQTWSWTLQETPSSDASYTTQVLTIIHDGVAVRSVLRLLPQAQDASS